jgi:hypothetical protein
MGMETTINWARLYSQGRCKDIGIAWTPEEHNAVLKLNIPPAYVRQGILTAEAYQAKLKEETKIKETPIYKLTDSELLAKAKELEIPATKGVSRTTIITAIETKIAEDKTDKKKSKDNPKK